MKVLLFGSSGFLGKSICKLFKEKQVEFYTVSRNETSNYSIDISDYNRFDILPNNFFDVVINCAVTLPGKNFLDNDYLDQIYKTNILGSQNICKWINTQAKISKIINCSTLVVVGKPWIINLNEEANTYPTGNHVLYSSSKLTQELIFQTFGVIKKIPVAQLRFSTLYGFSMNWNGIICSMIDQTKTNKQINLTNASKVAADFLHISDAAKIVLATLQSNISGIINAARGKETTLLELANTIVHNLIDQTISIKNIEDENFIIENAIIDVTKLKSIIEITDFIKLNEGIIEMLQP
jgi:UDP-glucose 4-epimerase